MALSAVIVVLSKVVTEKVVSIAGSGSTRNCIKQKCKIQVLTKEMTAGKIEIQISMAEPADAPSISAIMHESFIEYRASYTEKAFAATTPDYEQIISRMDEGPIWIAVRDSTIVGTVSVVSHSNALYIRGMAVPPSARGCRIGASLLKQVEDFAYSHKHKRLILSTTPFLFSAIRLYERMGFKRTNEGPHDLFGTPLFTMEKEIKPSG